jgi:hypothetical protein
MLVICDHNFNLADATNAFVIDLVALGAEGDACKNGRLCSEKPEALFTGIGELLLY